jgi:hypothetical protein
MDRGKIAEQVDLHLPKDEQERIKELAGVEEDGELSIDSISQPSTTAIKQSGRLDSDKYNQQFKLVYQDLLKLFKYVQSVDSRIDDNIDLNNEEFRRIKDMVKNLRKRIQRYNEIVNDTEGFEDIFVENFRGQNNFEVYNDNTNFLFSDNRNNSALRDYDGVEKLDLDPTIFHKEMVCKPDEYGDSITLSALESIRSHNMIAEIEEQVGSNLVDDVNNVYGVENVADENLEEVWNEIILADRPFRVQIDKDEIDDNLGFYGEDDGALCKVRIIFDTAVPLNSINILPLSEFPMKLISIRAFESTEKFLQNNPDMILAPERTNQSIKVENLTTISGIEESVSDEDVVELIRKNGYDIVNMYNIEQIRDLDDLQTEEYQNQVALIKDFLLDMKPYNEFLVSQYIDDDTRLQFEPLHVKTFELAFKQEHYTLTQYNVSKKDKNNIKLMKRLFEDKIEKTSITMDNNIDNVLQLDKANDNNLWFYLEEIFKKLEEKIKIISGNDIIDKLKQSLVKVLPSMKSSDLNNVTSSNSTNNKSNNKERDSLSTTKYKYQYGAKSIVPSYDSYMSESVYVSKLQKFDTDIKQVGLEVKDFNPNIDDDMPATSIEYYVTNKKYPVPQDWYSIIPKNYKETNANKYGDMYSNWVMGEQLFPYDGSDSHIKCKLRFKATGGTANIELFKNGERITDDNKIQMFGDGEYIDVIQINNEKFSPNNPNIYTINYEISPAEDPYLVDFEEVASPISYTNKDGTQGELFEDTDINNSIRLSYYPYINNKKVFNIKNYVQEKIISDNGTDYREYPTNPTVGEYNPNNEDGYMPLDVIVKGEFDIFNADAGDYGQIITNNYEATGVEQDIEGVPYSIVRDSSLVDTWDFNYIRWKEETVEEDLSTLTRKDEAPYIVNKTDYVNDKTNSPKKYDPNNYPVLDYIQVGKNITFSTNLDDHTIRVKYDYLVEGIRVKAIMRRNVSGDSGYTPELKSYQLKVKGF